MLSRENTKSAAEFWRMFCAVEITTDLRSSLQDHIDGLRKKLPNASASWPRSEKLHLTLKFFGDVNKEAVPKISLAATRAVAHLEPFDISIGRSGVFPSPGKARVLWIGVGDPSESLIRLHGRLDQECEKEGFGKEERVFRPHLTIARLRPSADARKLAETHLQTNFDPRTLTVNELLVIRSKLGGGGSSYVVVSRHALQYEGKMSG